MATATKGKEVRIPGVKLVQTSIKIRGITPLITNRFSEDAKDSIEGKHTGKKPTQGNKGRKPRNPQKEFEDALYRVPGQENIYGVPAGGIKLALVKAGGRFTDQTMTTLRGAFSIPGEIIPIKGSKPEMRRDVVRNSGIGRGADLRYRPMFREWEVDVPVILNADIVTIEQLINLFQICGFSIGLGDWRVECNGIYGQFEVVNE